MKTTKLFSLAIALVCIVTNAQSQTLVGWNFNTPATYLQATTIASTISGTPVISYGSGVIGVANGTACAGSLATSASDGYIVTLDVTKYLEFTLTPVANAAINISSFTTNIRSNGNGPVSYEVRTSDDAFTSSVVSGIGIPQSACQVVNTPAFSYSSTDAVTFRIYFYGGTGAGASVLDIEEFAAVGYGNLLPVQLLSFTGSSKASSNLLQWSVSKEENFSHYIVERSTDGRSYSPIGKISGAGRGSYEFVDTKPGAKNLYRLQMVDKDGRQNATKILMVANKPKAIIANIVPNMVSGNATLRLASEKPTTVSLYAFDVSGKRTPLGNHNLSGGEQQIPLKLAALAAGVYQLSIVSAAGQTETVRFVKQ